TNFIIRSRSSLFNESRMAHKMESFFRFSSSQSFGTNFNVSLTYLSALPILVSVYSSGGGGDGGVGVGEGGTSPSSFNWSSVAVFVFHPGLLSFRIIL